ncbi:MULTISPECIES: hypothetical protein [Pseudomonas]|uniref:hypothetical protein n=1 Tax=Pseudomonas TaxID=286 RepID=UPI001EEE27E9|nr:MULTISPECIES: hypothetical protein [Pseudomonas]
MIEQKRAAYILSVAHMATEFGDSFKWIKPIHSGEPTMPQYIPLTNNCDLPCLAIDSHAPLADLHNNALLRIRVATELLESFARNEMMGADGQDLQCVSQAAALLLRDGCDVLDVLGRQLRRGSDSAGGGSLQG